MSPTPTPVSEKSQTQKHNELAEKKASNTSLQEGQQVVQANPLGQKAMAPHRALRKKALTPWWHRLALSWRNKELAKYPEDWAKSINDLATKGTIVYVLKGYSPGLLAQLDRLFLHGVLPPASWVAGVRAGLLTRLMRRGNSRHPLEEHERWTQERLESGDHGIVVLDKAWGFGGEKPRTIESLLQGFAKGPKDRQVYLVPHLRVDGDRTKIRIPTPERTSGSWLGSLWPRWPSAARIDACDPVALHQHEGANSSRSQQALSIRNELVQRLTRAEQLTLGPPKKTQRTMREEVFEDAVLKRQLEEISRTEGRHPGVLVREGKRIYDTIAAKQNIALFPFLDKILGAILRTIYDGVHCNIDDVTRVREAGKKGPIIVVPSHRSHMDYLVISQSLFKNDISAPMIAAGDNLNFFPIGSLFRRGGAYFIRRSFKDDRLYGSILKAYVRKLFKEGHTQEFFIEGGRSRSGKTLPPKFGILKILVDAFFDGNQEDAVFCPAHVAYENLIENSAYRRELEGASKEKESAKGLFKALNTLRSRFGQVFITYHKPISIREFIQEQGISIDELRGQDSIEARRHVVQELAYRITFGINQAATVTAPAIAILTLFGFRRRGLHEHTLHDTVALIVAHIKGVAIEPPRISEGLAESPGPLIDRALESLVESGHIVRESAADSNFYRIADDKYLDLDFYKNSILHFLVPEAIVALALRALAARPGQAISIRNIKRETKFLSRLFKHEFIFDPRENFDSLFESTIARIVDYGILEWVEDGMVAWSDSKPSRRLGVFASNLLLNFVDSYDVCSRHLINVLGSPKTEKLVIKDLIEHARADFLANKISTRESAHAANIKNALKTFVSLGVITYEDGESGRRLKLCETREPLIEINNILGRIRAFKG